MEYQEGGPYGSIYAWGPSGSWAPHSAHTPAGGGYDPILGDNFGYYSAQSAETVGQITSSVFMPDTTYDLGAWGHRAAAAATAKLSSRSGTIIGGVFELLRNQLPSP